MKNKSIYASVMLIAFLSLSCSHKEEDTLRPAARELFMQTRSLLSAYSDSIVHAADSASLARIDLHFQERLTSINSAVPPNTDMHLTQGENDTIYQLTRKYVILRNRRDAVIQRGPQERKDSTSNGSGSNISQPKPVKQH